MTVWRASEVESAVPARRVWRRPVVPFDPAIGGIGMDAAAPPAMPRLHGPQGLLASDLQEGH